MRFIFGVLLFGAGLETGRVWASPSPVATPALLSPSSSSLSPAPASSIEPDPLFSIRDLFSDNVTYSVRLHHSGKKVLFLAPWEGNSNLYTAEVDDIENPKLVTTFKEKTIRASWTFLDDVMLIIADVNGDENNQYFSVDCSGNSTRAQTEGAHADWTVEGCVVTPLVSAPGVRGVFVAASPRDPENLILGMNDRNPQFFDLYKVNVRTGERELVFQNDAFLSFEFDQDLNLRLASGLNGTDTVWSLITETGEKVPFKRFTLDDGMGNYPLAFDATGEILFFTDVAGRDIPALMSANVSDPHNVHSERVVFTHPLTEIRSVLQHPTTKKVEATKFEYTTPEWTAVEGAPESMRKALEILRANPHGPIESIERSLDDKTWLVTFGPTDGPVTYAIFDPEKATEGGEGLDALRVLFVSRPYLEDLPLAAMEPLLIPSRDNFTLVSYITLPRWEQERRARGEEPQPYPMVLMVHGGPWSRDRYRYSTYHQIFANRGYAVLSVNFRGSSGFGREFLTAAFGEWGGKMQKDLLDAVAWAVENNYAKANQTCIFGGSYGGYATLAGLTLTPEAFTCGVSLVGISSLISFLDTFPSYWLPFRNNTIVRLGGDPATKEGRAFLESRSPVYHVDQIRRPLLIVHGANDPRVAQAESEQIVAAMQNHSIPVAYLLFEDEGHGLSKEPNRLAFLAAMEAFLAANLEGGRCACEPELLADARAVARADTLALLGGEAPSPSPVPSEGETETETETEVEEGRWGETEAAEGQSVTAQRGEGLSGDARRVLLLRV